MDELTEILIPRCFNAQLSKTLYVRQLKKNPVVHTIEEG